MIDFHCVFCLLVNNVQTNRFSNTRYFTNKKNEITVMKEFFSPEIKSPQMCLFVGPWKVDSIKIWNFSHKMVLST
jgi:hypothetical protein